MTTRSVARAAEHLVCAELSRRELIATTFTHNIPKYDILVAGSHCRSVALQVKGTSSESWSFEATDLLQIRFDPESEIQAIEGEIPCQTPKLIWVCVAVEPVSQNNLKRDRFFILTESELRDICIKNYRTMLEGCNWHRPKKWQSVRYFWDTEDLKPYEDAWSLISDRLKVESPQTLSENY